MFETAVLAHAPAGRRTWSACAGFTAQAILVGCAILIPMLWPEAMPPAQTWLNVFLPAVPPPPPPPAAAGSHTKIAAARPLFDGGFYQPVTIPGKVALIEDSAPESAGIGVPGGVPGGQNGGAAGGVLSGILDSAAFHAPLPAPAASASAKAIDTAPRAIPRIKAGGVVKLATPIVRVEPVYPPLARQMRIAGVVELTGIIGVDGRWRELRVLRGHPLLAPAAIEAVRQWIYAPTTLNGEPVEVIAPITVTFRLN
jgi:protein TonB